MISDFLNPTQTEQLTQLMKQGEVEAGNVLDGGTVKELLKMGLAEKNKNGNWCPNWENIKNGVIYI